MRISELCAGCNKFLFRSTELTLRKGFEAQVWHIGKSFINYFYEKIILALPNVPRVF